MKKHILIYGLSGGLLIVALKLIEYRFLVVEHSVEIYGGLVAAVFAGLGIWLGLKLTKKKEAVVGCAVIRSSITTTRALFLVGFILRIVGAHARTQASY